MPFAVSLELVNTVGTLLTAAIIGATALAALFQLRHMRAGNQIAAMISISENLERETFKDAEYLVAYRLASAMSDPGFREYMAAFIRGNPPRDVEASYTELRRAADKIGDTYGELGILLKIGVVDKALVLDRYCGVIIEAWGRLRDYTAFARDIARDPGIWENFEYITVLAENWLKAYPSSYPRGLRRLEAQNRWPVPPAAPGGAKESS